MVPTPTSRTTTISITLTFDNQNLKTLSWTWEFLVWDIHSPQDFSWQTEKPRRQKSPTLSASFHKASFGLSAQVPGLSPASCSTTKTSFFLQGLSSDLITFSGHSLISESFLPRTPVRPCLPHIFSFSLQNTEHDIPRCAHASPVCSVLF